MLPAVPALRRPRCAAAVLCTRLVPRASDARHALATGRAAAVLSARAPSLRRKCCGGVRALGSSAVPRRWCSLHPGQLRARTGSPKCVGRALRPCDGTTPQRIGRAPPPQRRQGVETEVSHALRCDCGCTTSEGTPHPTSVSGEGVRRLGQGVVWDKRVSQSIGQYGGPRGVIMRLPLGPGPLRDGPCGGPVRGVKCFGVQDLHPGRERSPHPEAHHAPPLRGKGILFISSWTRRVRSAAAAAASASAAICLRTDSSTARSFHPTV